MSLTNDVNAVKADAAKVESAVKTDVSKLKTDVTKVETEVVGFWNSTHTTKVLAVVAAVAFVLGAIAVKVL
jgi:hypothetical protein